MAIEHILGLVIFIVIVLTLSLILPTNDRRKTEPDGGGVADGSGSSGWSGDGGSDCGGGDGGGD